MKTFILLTFGFLGLALYEMSGGADFVPASAGSAQAETETPTPTVETASSATHSADANDTVLITKIDTTPDVTRVSLDLTSVSDAAVQVSDSQTPETTEAIAAAVNAANIIDSTETPQIILPSLIATTDDGSQPVRATDLGGDIRRVSGNRVNVRGGPSTDYGVVGKLTRGDEVQIIEDNGDGWVLMQPLDGGAQGWMADFLLTSG